MFAAAEEQEDEEEEIQEQGKKISIQIAIFGESSMMVTVQFVEVSAYKNEISSSPSSASRSWGAVRA